MPVQTVNLFGALLAAFLFAASAHAQESGWRDPSPHQVQFVTVDENVRLEVLDWGGAGRPIVLLTGLGDSAHVYDDFAQRLTRIGHVYGITRRGYGASSIPASGYGADRLGDDVLAVLASLGINRPILVGHSIAGQELSSIGSRHPERVAGLVYLDALFSYAYATPQEVNLRAALLKLRNDLDVVASRPFTPLGSPQPPDLVTAVMNTMSEVQRQLSALQLPAPSTPRPSPTTADLASYAAFGSWFARVRGLRPLEAELRQMRPPTSEGRVGPPSTPPTVPAAIRSGMQSFSDIRVPALALCAMPEVSQGGDARLERAFMEARQAAFEANVTGARVVRVPGADHYIWVSNESDVLRDIGAFVNNLK